MVDERSLPVDASLAQGSIRETESLRRGAALLSGVSARLLDDGEEWPRVLWRVKPPDVLNVPDHDFAEISMQVADDVVVVGTHNGLAALSLATGSLVWSLPVSPWIDNDLHSVIPAERGWIVIAGKPLVLSSDGLTLYDPVAGEALWSMPITLDWQHTSGLTSPTILYGCHRDEGVLFLIDENEGDSNSFLFVAVDIDTGCELWTHSVGGWPSGWTTSDLARQGHDPPLPVGGIVLLQNGVGWIAGVAARSGQWLWDSQDVWQPWPTPVVAGKVWLNRRWPNDVPAGVVGLDPETGRELHVCRGIPRIAANKWRTSRDELLLWDETELVLIDAVGGGVRWSINVRRVRGEGSIDPNDGLACDAWRIDTTPDGGWVLLWPSGIVVVDAATGAIRWSHKTASRSLPSRNWSVGRNRLYLSEAGLLTAFSAHSGRMLWRTAWPIAGSFRVRATPEGERNDVLVTIDQNFVAHALDARTGCVLRSTPILHGLSDRDFVKGWLDPLRAFVGLEDSPGLGNWTKLRDVLLFSEADAQSFYSVPIGATDAAQDMLDRVQNAARASFERRPNPDDPRWTKLFDWSAMVSLWKDTPKASEADMADLVDALDRLPKEWTTRRYVRMKGSALEQEQGTSRWLGFRKVRDGNHIVMWEGGYLTCVDLGVEPFNGESS